MAQLTGIKIKAVVTGLLAAVAVGIPGMIALAACSLFFVTDFAHNTGVLPSLGIAAVWLFCAVAGGYVAGRVAKQAELKNGFVLGVLNLCLIAWNWYDDSGKAYQATPAWLNIFSAVSAIPVTMLGALLAERRGLPVTPDARNVPAPASPPEGLGVFPFILGALSFIPLLGVPIGIVLVVWGLVTEKRGGKWLSLIGACGVGTTIAIFSSLHYFAFVKQAGPFRQLDEMQARQFLPMAVQSIEYYKIQQGKYPADLDEVAKAQPSAGIYLLDPTNEDLSGPDHKKFNRFYYEPVGGNHYYLLATGPDHKPFTDDDIVPNLKPGEKTGLLIKGKR